MAETTPKKPAQSPTPPLSLPEGEETPPVAKNASWGVFVSIVIILAMIIIGAFYSWGNRVAQQHPQAVQTNL